VLDRRLIEAAKPALESRQPVEIEMPIRNTDRTAGAMLSGEIARRFGHKGLRDDTIKVRLRARRDSPSAPSWRAASPSS
jgi:glutamate synthase (NADPH) large chain